MRLSVASLRRMVKRPVPVGFVHQELTSYIGLELLRRYPRQLALPCRPRSGCTAIAGNYGGGRLALLFLTLFYVGVRRPEHLRYVAGDPLTARVCGLARIPTARTVGNWLRQHPGGAQTPLSQTHLYVPDPEHANAPLPPPHSCRSPDPHWWSPRPAPAPQPGHRDPPCVRHSTPGRLSIFDWG